MKEKEFELKMSNFWRRLFYFNLMLQANYSTQTHEILTQKTSSTVTGVRKKIGSVTREARNVRFFWVSRSLFLDHKFKRFLLWLEFKWSFVKLKEEILIGKQCFSTVFCWKFNLGEFFTLIFYAMVHDKVKIFSPNC